jgi:hypothetical protein
MFAHYIFLKIYVKKFFHLDPEGSILIFATEVTAQQSRSQKLFTAEDAETAEVKIDKIKNA